MCLFNQKVGFVLFCFVLINGGSFFFFLTLNNIYIYILFDDYKKIISYIM